MTEGGQLSDARADWLVGSAVTHGLDPFGDVVQLAAIYELDLLTPLGLRTLAGRLLLAIAVLVPIFVVKQAQLTRESAHVEFA